MDETNITKGGIVKDEYDVSLDIEEIEDISKVDKSREVDDSIVKGESNEECQYDILDETNITGEFVNKHKFNVGLSIEEIEDVIKEEKSMKKDELKLRIESNEKCQYDMLDGTVITEGCIFKDFCNDGLDIEEIIDHSKVENAREVAYIALNRESNDECKYDILDETEVTGVNKDTCHGQNLGEIEDLRKVEKFRKGDDNAVKREDNEEFQYDILDETDNTDHELNFEAIKDDSKVEKIQNVDEHKMKRKSNEEVNNDVLDETFVTDGYVNEDEVKEGLTIDAIEDISKPENNKSKDIEDSDNLINERMGKEVLNSDIVEDIRKSASVVK